MTYAIYKFSPENNVAAVSNASWGRLDSFGVFAVILSLGLIAAAMFLPHPRALDASALVLFTESTPL